MSNHNRADHNWPPMLVRKPGRRGAALLGGSASCSSLTWAAPFSSGH